MADEKDAQSQSAPAEEAEPKAPSPSEAAGEQKQDAKEEQAPKEAGSADAAPAQQEAGGQTRRGRGRGSRVVPVGIAHIRSTFNNTVVSITDTSGGVVSWCSAGRAGFKGSRKSTSFAATVVGQDAARQAVARGMHEVEVRVQGAGSGRESAIRALQSSGLTITVIKDVTPIPHNGCRSRKRRRV